LKGVPRVLARFTGRGLPEMVTPRFVIQLPVKKPRSARTFGEAHNFCCMPIMKFQF
jgi:hypothetical protein